MVYGGGGGSEGGAPASATAGVASILILRANQARTKVFICNDSDTVIYLARAETARLNAGIRLNPNGGTIIDEPDSIGRIYTGPWSAISSAATKVLTIDEE